LNHPRKGVLIKRGWLISGSFLFLCRMETIDSYPVIHWLISLFITPFLFFLMPDSVTIDLSLLPYYWIFSLILSVPVLAIYYTCYYLLRKKMISAIMLKILLDGICIICIFILFAIMAGSLEFVLSTVYSIGVTLVSLFLKIKRKEPKISN
jgi:hypothetical protein